MSSSKDIRQQFIDFFKSKGHNEVPSSPVVPSDDPTLLFANAGMNQFKNIFLGIKEAEVKRAVNSQKCIRAGGKHNDLEEVGKDGYHHTFFEMLGNWSFGDYYKKEAIVWAWELLTDLWRLPKDKLHATVHHTDSEAYDLWKELTDIKHDHISYHGDKDNFWEMGETGPCGPCSEIHFDKGEEHCDRQNEADHICEVNGNCSRYIELWNLVFIQYKREENRELTPLKDRFVDTGAGLERIAQVLQHKNSNYETDLFVPIIEQIAKLSGVQYIPESGISHRVVADHIRCLCFALADGGFPSNEGRGYVLRRILRRAARHGRLLGFREPFLYHLVDSVIGIMGHHFYELKGKDEYIKMVIRAEEERFNHTLDTGLERFADICARLETTTISGKDAFMLYDTFGFPLDLTLILAEEKGLGVDTSGFDNQMESQKERARKASKFSLQNEDIDWIELKQATPTEFTGYDSTETESYVQRYYLDADQQVGLQLDRTPFFAESGGQLADTGRIFNAGFEAEITDVRKAEDAYIHIGRLVRGFINNQPVIAKIDDQRRKDIKRNHTATHLLHKALKSVLGEHVQQKGSLVAPGYLRFDFTHVKALSKDEIDRIESTVNLAILDNLPLNVRVLPIAEARLEGAVALFGEKYGDQVRVVSIEDFSKELCGGTHVQSSGEIGLFKIIGESSSAAGIRRIEAITGRAALAFVEDLQNRITSIANTLHCPEYMIDTKLESLQKQIREMEVLAKQYSAKQAGSLVDELLDKAVFIDGYRLINREVQVRDAEQLRQLGDAIRDKAKDIVAVLFSRSGEKLNILTVLGAEMTSRLHAGKIAAQVALLVGGKGGGRPDSAMAGGKDIDRIPHALATVPDIIKSML
ncbi:MAG: alanine--tRNA ligase [Candidatus Cloacimonadaceae bacterium]|nr:alanine--tRNA ligase [Candidatus Cloacimonadaceae bacterium]MDP3115436.1 alanine--tRNA ligase [Candidatus Cloacimonadaceae bacterium]